MKTAANRQRQWVCDCTRCSHLLCCVL